MVMKAKAKKILRKSAASIGAAILAIGLSTAATFAASSFEGIWKVQDTQGNPFQIVLDGDGSARGDRAGEGLTGTWKEAEGSAVIDWESGWTTKITKDGGNYTKTAYEKGKAVTSGPGTPAEKVP
jgi:hypothetical protein